MTEKGTVFCVVFPLCFRGLWYDREGGSECG